jgi:hypothetical protein
MEIEVGSVGRVGRRSSAALAVCLACAAGCGDGNSSSDAPRTADVCLNPVVYSPGATVVAVYRPSDADTGKATGPDFVRTASVTGPVSFQGTQALDRSVTDGDNYGRHQFFVRDGPTLVVHGSALIQDLYGNPVTAHTVAYSPPSRTWLDFSLRAGETRTETLEALVNGDRTEVVKASITFVGFESVATAAGVFEGACHFAYPSTREGIDTTEDVWIARGTGVEVRSLSVVVVYEDTASGPSMQAVRRDRRLVQATLNGALVTP